jgi:fatty acid/phospholipid biosynthesis enzyme
LLGLNGNVMKAHGAARERAVMHAVRVTADAIEHQITQRITEEIAAAHDCLAREGHGVTTAAFA